MESLWRSREFSDSDLKDFNYTEIAAWRTLRTSTSVLKDQCWLKEAHTKTSDEWTDWLKEAVPQDRTTNNTFALAISPRAVPPLGEILPDQPAALRYLAITEPVLKSSLKIMKLHRALIVLVKRGVPVISRIRCVIDDIQNCLVYTLRVDHTLDHQTAMTITYVPSTEGTEKRSMTNAMIVGYDASDADSLLKKLKSCKEEIFSPFTLIKAFLHVERVRRFEENRHKITNFRTIMENYGKIPVGEEILRPVVGINKQDPKNLIPLYIAVCTHKNQLMGWRAQIMGFRDHATTDFAVDGTKPTDIDPKDYLQSLLDEYDGRINRCDLVLQGASLAFQMETAHLSRLDALSALRDSKQLKAIAILTMVFLPGTFIATVLAIPEFEKLKSSTNVAPWAWYLIMFLPLTAIVLGAYSLWVKLYRSKDEETVAAMV